MNKINKEFVLKYIEEIKAFCKGEKVECKEYKGNWFNLLDDTATLLINSNEKISTDFSLRIKPKKKFVYINSWIDNSGDFQHEFKSEYNSSKEAVDRYCHKIDIDYLSIAVKTEVGDE